MKVYIMVIGPGHMTKIAAMPIHVYGKNLKKNLFENQKSDNFETWH